MRILLFEIPIYSAPINRIKNYWEEKYTSRQQLRQPHHSCKFNEIIGYISVFKENFDIVGQLSFDTRSKIILGGHPKIALRPGTFFRLHLKENQHSDEILEKLCSELDEVAINRCFRKRYIDREAFNNIAKHVDWHKAFFASGGIHGKNNLVSKS